MNLSTQLALHNSMSHSNQNVEVSLACIITTIVVSLYVIQVFVAIVFLIGGDFDTKKEFWAWVVPFYAPIIIMVNKFKELE